jgi:membrane protein
VSVTTWIDAYQRRHHWIGYPLAVVYKFFDDQGPYLAALITYYGFLSIFPLLLLLATVLGFVLSDNPQLQAKLLDSALSQFPVIGPQLRSDVTSLHGSGLGLAVGIVGTIYGGLGVAQASQNALNRAWGVPRNERPNPLLARARSVLLLLLFAVGVVVTTGLSTLGAMSDSFGTNVGLGVRIAAIALAVLANVLLFVVAFRLLTARRTSVSDVLVGAVVAGVGWQLMQTLGAWYVRRRLQGATEVYGLFGLVLGLLAWIYLVAIIIVAAAEIDSVRRRHLWPRSLLTPFTDDVDLTHADKRAYRSYATSERFKGFEDVDVTFDESKDRDQR